MCTIFKIQENRESGTERLSWNVSNQLAIYATQHLKRVKASITPKWKPETSQIGGVFA